MFGASMEANVSILKLTSAMARHATHAHQITAQNLSRTDIPDATRHHVRGFEASLRALSRSENPKVINSHKAIDVEAEMLSAAQAKGRHEAAIAFWQSGLKMMRLAIGAPQG